VTPSKSGARLPKPKRNAIGQATPLGGIPEPQITARQSWEKPESCFGIIEVLPAPQHRGKEIPHSL
jgi:hypothetical protein